MSTPMALDASLAKFEWINQGLTLIARKVRERTEFTSDDLRADLPEPPTQNCVGSLIALARNRGLIEEKARRRSTRSPRNGSRLTVWGPPETAIAEQSMAA